MFSANVPPSTAGCCTEKEEGEKLLLIKTTHIISTSPSRPDSKILHHKGPSLLTVSGSASRKGEAIVGHLPVTKADTRLVPGSPLPVPPAPVRRVTVAKARAPSRRPR